MATTTATAAGPFLSAEQVFDAVGPAYEDAFEGLPEQAASIDWILGELAAADIACARTVDIGCGTGKPVCAALAQTGHDVLGIDVSGEMVMAARERVPAARFEQVDIRAFNPPPGAFDVATVYFSLLASVTQAEIRDFIGRIHQLLKPGGLFVFATVPIDAESLQINWMGHPVQVSSLSPEAGVQAVREAGFDVVHDAVTKFTPKGAEAGICKPEDVWEETHLFVYAKKPTSG